MAKKKAPVNALIMYKVLVIPAILAKRTDGLSIHSGFRQLPLKHSMSYAWKVVSPTKASCHSHISRANLSVPSCAAH